MNITEALETAPHLIFELRAKTEPEHTSQGRAPKGPKRPAPANLTTIDDADTIYKTLTETTHEIAHTLATKPPHTTGNHTHGLPANTTPTTAYTHTKKLCTFITHQLPQLPQDHQNEIGDRLTTTINHINNRHPVNAKPEHVNARCAKCSTLAIERRPPTQYGADETYTCTNCGKWHTEKEIIERMAARQRELKTRKKTA